MSKEGIDNLLLMVVGMGDQKFPVLRIGSIVFILIASIRASRVVVSGYGV